MADVFYIYPNNEKKLTLVWTPKAGSNTALRTFFDYVGFKFEPDVKIHEIRDEYRKGTNDELYTKIQFCRNPYSRIVSGYLQGLKNDFQDIRTSKRSFFDFLKKVQGHNPDNFDSHTKRQYNIDVDYLIRLENIEDDLQKLKEETGIDLKLNSYEYHSYRKLFAGIDNKIKVNPYEFSNELACTVAYVDCDTKVSVEYSDFFNDEIKNMVSDLFKKDLEYFGYDYPY